jgi:hypothetical protein
MSEYLNFVKLVPKPGIKTEIWGIESRRSGDLLGIIQWYGPWRQYVFFPSEETLFNSGCLMDIREFISTLMEIRKVGNR